MNYLKYLISFLAHRVMGNYMRNAEPKSKRWYGNLMSGDPKLIVTFCTMQIFLSYFQMLNYGKIFLTRSDKNYVFHLEDFPHMTANSYQECMCIHVSHMITCMSCPNTNTVKLCLYILCGDPLKCHKTRESVKPGNIVLMDIWPGLYKKCVKSQKTQYVGT
jgi:hypothetical protein